jgi:signal transduction histidine kinase
MKRNLPIIVLGVGLLSLLGAFVWYTQDVATNLRAEAREAAAIYEQAFRAMSDTSGGGQYLLAMTDIVSSIRKMRVPVVVTDGSGRPTIVMNIPGDLSVNDPRVAEVVKELDRQNPPANVDGGGQIHFGNTPLINGMRVIPALLVGVLAVMILTGLAMLLARSRAERESVFAGMARESAHQLGTPLSSLQGWIELLRDREDPMVVRAVPHMESDVERLERVAHRFERIGRPPKRESVDLGAVAQGVVDYFAVRVPTLAKRVTLSVERAEGPLVLQGDRVLLEWAVESLVKNAVDALADQGGTIVVAVAPRVGGAVSIRVADDGPGVPRELRRKIFSAGFSTKERGWGIGLALTRRIVEVNHNGRLALLPSDRGAVFEIFLPG